MAIHPSAIQAEAERRVQAALVHIESAQHELERACQELSPIIGRLPDYNRTAKLAAKAHELWRRISYVRPRNRYGLDAGGLADLARRLGTPAPGEPR